MGFNGAGVWSPAVDHTDERDSGVKMLASNFDLNMDEVKAGLEMAILKDGQDGGMMADLDLNTNQIKALGAGTALTDAATLSQVQNSAGQYALAAGSSNAYTVTLSPVVTSYVAGQTFKFLANHTNTGSVTIDVNGLGAKSIKKVDGATDLLAGDLQNGAIYAVVYDGTNFQLASSSANTASANDVNAGTDSNKAVTPDALAGSYAGTKTITFVTQSYTVNVATGDGQAYIHVPAALNGMNIVSAHARVITAGTTGTTEIQIHNVTDSVDIFSTKLTIDSSETGSETAANPVVIDTGTDDLSTNDLLRLDIDAVSTTPPKGLIVTLECRLP